MRLRTILCAGAAPAVVALAGTTVAVAQAPAPTLSFDVPCASEVSGQGFSGAGYTPGGGVSLLFQRDNRIAALDTRADAAGAVDAEVGGLDPDDFLDDDELAGDILVTANDETRIEQGAPPESQFAAAGFRLSRFAVFTSGVPVPGRRMRLKASGFVGASGKPLYLHYRRGSRTLKSVRLGTLRGACGGLTKTVRAFPFKPVRAGDYRLTFGTSRRAAAGISITYTVRVKRRDAIG